MRSYNQRVALTDRQKKHLRRLGHDLHPLVLVGQRGLTEGVVGELRQTLHDHELVKVRARVGDRENRNLVLAKLAADSGSELVCQIGNVGLFYKKNNKLNKITSSGFLSHSRRTARISKLCAPPGAATSTSSPADLPISARAIGEVIEMSPLRMSASSSPTIW